MNNVRIMSLDLQSGGPSWEVPMGRRDGLTASKDAATNNIPGPNSSVSTLVAKFQNVGLSLNDMVALSGAGFTMIPVDYFGTLLRTRLT